jgi:hypothetical protein
MTTHEARRQQLERSIGEHMSDIALPERGNPKAVLTVRKSAIEMSQLTIIGDEMIMHGHCFGQFIVAPVPVFRNTPSPNDPTLDEVQYHNGVRPRGSYHAVDVINGEYRLQTGKPWIIYPLNGPRIIDRTATLGWHHCYIIIEAHNELLSQFADMTAFMLGVDTARRVERDAVGINCQVKKCNAPGI